MIYVKNYLNPKPPTFTVQNKNSFESKLLSLKGKMIIVFVNGGGNSGRGFTGILIDVLSDKIKLVTKLPKPPRKNNIYIHNHCYKNNNENIFGTCTFIMIEHITAILYNYQ